MPSPASNRALCSAPMTHILPAVVAPTDQRWFSYFRERYGSGPVDEVNFWRPASQDGFRALEPGQPFFFRLKAPHNAVAGFGFFAVWSRMPVPFAWEVFGEGNGDPTEEHFERRIGEYRQRFDRAADAPLSCIVLRDAVFLPESRWLPWGPGEGWHPNLVTYKGYDLATNGRALAELLQGTHPDPVPDLQPAFELLEEDARAHVEVARVDRRGQGTFRLRLLEAYGGQCAVTGEHATPVLDAAHIQPYLGPASNHPQNGLVLRSDLHRLYDSGYVTVTPDLRLEVSSRLRDEFENGRHYYQMAGREIHVPREHRLAPSVQALEWHAGNVFR
ncbi:MAG: HNH endonuclease [Chloroflexi bacterium]|nr:HNH endonuclease [Chloroflexota bacterium]